MCGNIDTWWSFVIRWVTNQFPSKMWGKNTYSRRMTCRMSVTAADWQYILVPLDSTSVCCMFYLFVGFVIYFCLCMIGEIYVLFVGCLSFLLFTKLVCYEHVFPCIHIWSLPPACGIIKGIFEQYFTEKEVSRFLLRIYSILLQIIVCVIVPMHTVYSWQGVFTGDNHCSFGAFVFIQQVFTCNMQRNQISTKICNSFISGRV